MLVAFRRDFVSFEARLKRSRVYGRHLPPLFLYENRASRGLNRERSNQLESEPVFGDDVQQVKRAPGISEIALEVDHRALAPLS